MCQNGEQWYTRFLRNHFTQIFTTIFTLLSYTIEKLGCLGKRVYSTNECPTDRIKALVHHFLKSMEPNISSYIKDTTHFLCMLNPKGELPEDTIIVTLDVMSLYTNIPNDYLLKMHWQTTDHFIQIPWIQLWVKRIFQTEDLFYR